MKRIMSHCLAIFMIQHVSSETDCTEPQLLVKETYCGYDNSTSLTMYAYHEELEGNVTDTSVAEGCDIDFSEPCLNKTIFIECEIVETNCFDDHLEEEKAALYLECEEVEIFGNVTMATPGYNDTKDNFSKINAFINVTTTDHSVILTDAIVHLPDGGGTRTETAVTEDNNRWSTLHVFENETAISQIPKTDFAVAVTDTTVKSADVDVSINETAITDDSRSTFDLFGNESATTSEISVVRNETAIPLKEVEEGTSDSSEVLIILGYTAAVLGATVGIVFGAYRLRSLKQSGKYLLPDTPNPPVFIELA